VHDLRSSRRCRAHPHHRLWVEHLRRSGQRDRLPYWTPMMPEEEDAMVLAAFAERGGLP
jgi:hypothetical protein